MGLCTYDLRGRSFVYSNTSLTGFSLWFGATIRENLSLQDLKDYMRQAGEVTYADAHKQRRNEG